MALMQDFLNLLAAHPDSQVGGNKPTHDAHNGLISSLASQIAAGGKDPNLTHQNTGPNGAVQQFVQGVGGTKEANISGEPLTNPLDMTNDQAYSPYGAGVLANVAVGAIPGVKALEGAVDAEKIKNGVTEAMTTAKSQKGGLEAGFIGKSELPDKPGAIPGTPEKPPVSPVRITLKPSVYGAGREANVQKTVDTIVPGATSAEKYKSLQPTMDDLGNKITQIMTQNPKAAPLAQIMSDYDKNLQNEGVYRTSASTKDNIQQTAQKYISDLQNEASGNNEILNPTEISDIGLQKIKQQVNQDAQSIYKKIENGTTLTDKDRVILAARQTLDDTLTSLHPEIKDLTTQQSHLYDAADSLYKGREGEVKDAQKIADQQANEPGTIKKILTNPFVEGAIGSAVTGGVGFGLYKGLPILGGMMEKGDTNKDSINTAKKYDMSTPLDDGSLINEQAQAKKQGDLQAKIKAEQLNDPNQANIDQGLYDQSKTDYDSQSNIRQVANDTKTLISTANNASQSIVNISPNFMNSLSQGYDSAAKANSGEYAAVVADLKTLSNLSGVDLSTARSKEALQAAIDKIVQNQKTKLDTAKTQYSGPTPKKTTQPTQAPQGLPPTPGPIVDWQKNDPQVQSILNQGGLPPLQ